MLRLIIVGVSLVGLAAIGIVLLVLNLKGMSRDKKTLKELQGLVVQDAEKHRLSLSDTFIYHMGGFYIALDPTNRKMIYRLLPNEEKVLDFSDIKSFSSQDRVDEWTELVQQLSQSSSDRGIGNMVAGAVVGGAMGAGMVAAGVKEARKPVPEMTSQEIESRLRGHSFLNMMLNLSSGETVTFPMMVHGAHSWENKYRELAQDQFRTLYILLKKSFLYSSIQQ